MALLDRDRRPSGDDRGSLVDPAATSLDHGPLVVAEIAYGRDPHGELDLQGAADDGVELVSAQLEELVERSGAAVSAQMYVSIDQPRKQGCAREMGHLTAGWRSRRSSLDSKDLAALDEDQRAARYHPFAIEGRVSPISVHVAPQPPERSSRHMVLPSLSRNHAVRPPGMVAT